MNCKPGDLAVIVSGPLNVGRIVNVLQCSKYGLGWWWVESAAGPLQGRFHETGYPGAGLKGHIQDARLRPIRDPGDDARDETLHWLPVPSTQEEHA